MMTLPLAWVVSDLQVEAVQGVSTRQVRFDRLVTPRPAEPLLKASMRIELDRRANLFPGHAPRANKRGLRGRCCDKDWTSRQRQSKQAIHQNDSSADLKGP